jgi:aconitate hydratase
MNDLFFSVLNSNLAVVRARLGRPLTGSEKVLFGHLVDPAHADLRPGESWLALKPDRVVFQDVLGQTGMLQFMQTDRRRVAVPASIHCDHLVEARQGALVDLRASRSENGEVYDFLRAAAARYGLDFWGPGAGIVHQVVLENYAFPGQLIVGTDSHTPNAGGLGACAIGVGGADAVEVLAGLPWELRYPRRIGVVLRGELGGWTAPKDVIAWLAGKLGVAGATHAILEYVGPGARSLSATGKATITNMGAELGATTSLFPADAAMERYLVATGRGAVAAAVAAHRELLAPDPEVERAPHAFYDEVVELDLTTLEPHVVGPHSPDRARPISVLAEEVRKGELVDAISATLVGSCTNSSYQDMSRAADVARQARAHGIAARAELWVTPGSARVQAALERDGQARALEAIGATVLASACGPCIGQWRRPNAPVGPNTIVTSYNRNFAGRNDGNPLTQSFIASPELACALALAGRLSFNPLTDELVGANGERFRLAPPPRGPEVPPAPLVGGTDALVPAPAVAGPAPKIDPASERLMMLPRWPAWDGTDLRGLRVLFKARGKTTTDQISPAGKWLRLRGHLERFSENFLSGAIDAETGAVGTALDPATGERAPVAAVARALRAAGVRWVVIGDWNYGEGSSREHAALSPRLLGGIAIVARSFARIHETNLKKQGLLALTFVDPADYDRVRSTDVLELVDLDRLAPDAPVTCRLVHADGARETIALRHSYSTTQLAWFRHGSALAAHAAAG